MAKFITVVADKDGSVLRTFNIEQIARIEHRKRTGQLDVFFAGVDTPWNLTGLASQEFVRQFEIAVGSIEKPETETTKKKVGWSCPVN